MIFVVRATSNQRRTDLHFRAVRVLSLVITGENSLKEPIGAVTRQKTVSLGSRVEEVRAVTKVDNVSWGRANIDIVP